MMLDRDIIISLVDGIIADIKAGTLTLPTFGRRTDKREIWFELSFCIASSQDRVRRATMAARCLAQAYDELRNSHDPLSTIREAFEREYVSLRFINRKSEQLAEAWVRLQEIFEVISSIDQNFESPTLARDYLISNFPGIGPKQASMFLRNIGWGSDLAIVDSHILQIASVLFDEAQSADRYMDLESRLRGFASDRGIALEKLDVILWSCSRMMKSKYAREPMLV